MSKFKVNKKRFVSLAGLIAGLAVFALFASTVVRAYAAEAQAQTAVSEIAAAKEHAEIQAAAKDPGVARVAFIAAAIAVGLGSAAAGLAVGMVGTAAIGAVGEKPDLAGRAIIFVGLAEGIAIYGLIIAIMILGKI
jgi:V/A-type H+/Na+-transporting ATPase subunit K